MRLLLLIQWEMEEGVQQWKRRSIRQTCDGDMGWKYHYGILPSGINVWSLSGRDNMT